MDHAELETLIIETVNNTLDYYEPLSFDKCKDILKALKRIFPSYVVVVEHAFGLEHYYIYIYIQIRSETISVDANGKSDYVNVGVMRSAEEIM